MMNNDRRQTPDNRNADDFFVVASTAGLTALKYWLEKRTYNNQNISKDRRGQDLVGLINETQDQKIKAGVICVSNKDYLQDVLAVVERHMAFD